MTIAYSQPEASMFFLVHTITCCNDSSLSIQAQYIHSIGSEGDLRSAQLLGRLVNLRMRVRVGNETNRRRDKSKLHLFKDNKLKTPMKPTNITHRLRIMKISSPQLPQQLPQLTDEVPNLHNSPPPQNGMLQEQKIEVHNNFKSEVLSVNASPEETAAWLSQNRFERYLQTFNSFRGVDMLRLSRDDLEKICGQVDGIRLYNALQSKALVTIYVRREDSMVYNAIFLSSFNSTKLLQELSILLDISPNQVRAVYIEGPQSIHIQLDEAMMRHIKEEAMYIVKVLEDGGYLLVLKQTDK